MSELERLEKKVDELKETVEVMEDALDEMIGELSDLEQSIVMLTCCISLHISDTYGI